MSHLYCKFARNFTYNPIYTLFLHYNLFRPFLVRVKFFKKTVTLFVIVGLYTIKSNIFKVQNEYGPRSVSRRFWAENGAIEGFDALMAVCKDDNFGYRSVACAIIIYLSYFFERIVKWKGQLYLTWSYY